MKQAHAVTLPETGDMRDIYERHAAALLAIVRGRSGPALR
jgi:hypothetical protein